MSSNVLFFDSIKAWDFLSQDQDSVLVDVRTSAEWSFVGIPDLTSINKQVECISWVNYPDMSFNTKFFEEFEKRFTDKEKSYLFICRSGGRSAIAAEKITEMGYLKCYNITDGFEGDLDQHSQHRNSVSGWKFNKLPWRQS